MISNFNPNIDKYFISKKSKREWYKVLKKVLKIGLDFKTNKNIIDVKDQKDIMKDLLEPFPKKGSSLKKILEEFKTKIMNGSVNFSNPNFMAFPDSGNALPSMIGHILSGMLNQNMINSIHTSPTATFVEISVVNWLREIAGYKVTKNPKNISEIGGVSVTGGVSANTIALLLARENKLPNTIKKGLKKDSKKIKIFIPKGIGHYSIKASMGWLGLGKENCIEVKTTPQFTIDQKDLIKKINLYRKENILMALVAYTGDSRTMAIDDFENLSKIAKKEGMWFHVDACHGLSLCLSEKLKKKVKGIHLADSLTIDPHKVLFTPYSSSYILVKNPKKFDLVSGVSDLITKEDYSLGKITPFYGSRAFNSLKLWFLIKTFGKENLGRLMEERHDLAKYFGKLLDKKEDFKVMNNIDINSIAYIYAPKEIIEDNKKSISKKVKEINKLNENIQKRIFEEGKYYIHTFKINDFKNKVGWGTNKIFQMQRLMIGNPLTKKRNLEKFLKYSLKIGKEEFEKIRR